MQNELKPCPACGSEKIKVSPLNPKCTSWVACSSCGTTGPYSPKRSQAIAAWNNLPRRKTEAESDVINLQRGPGHVIELSDVGLNWMICRDGSVLTNSKYLRVRKERAPRNCKDCVHSPRGFPGEVERFDCGAAIDQYGTRTSQSVRFGHVAEDCGGFKRFIPKGGDE